MGVGIGIVLLALGLVLALAVGDSVAGMDLALIGWILTAVGGLAIVVAPRVTALGAGVALVVLLALGGPVAMAETDHGAPAGAPDAPAASRAHSGEGAAAALMEGGTQGATTATAVGKVAKEVEEGNMKIEVESDTGAPGL